MGSPIKISVVRELGYEEMPLPNPDPAMWWSCGILPILVRSCTPSRGKNAGQLRFLSSYSLYSSN